MSDAGHMPDDQVEFWRRHWSSESEDPNVNGSGKIYFVTDGEHIKIGFTTKTIESRLATLQTGNPRKLRLIGWRLGSRIDELALHERFHSLRAEGEWFVATPEVRDCAVMEFGREMSGPGVELLTTDHVRRRLGVSRSEAHRISQKLPHVHVGRSLRVRADAFRRYLQERGL